MQYVSDQIAIAWGDYKGAALYFDYVIPALGPHPIDLPEAVRAVLLPRELDLEIDNIHEDEESKNYWEEARDKSFGDGAVPWAGLWYTDPGLAAQLQKFSSSKSLDSFSVYGAKFRQGDSRSDDLGLLLSGIDLIDTSKVSWDQILEFRKDVGSVQKIRRLRRLIYMEYLDKPPDLIRDELEDRINQYKEATKLWGFETGSGLFQIVLTAEALIGVAALGSALFGAPLALASVGGVAALGQCMLEITRRKSAIKLEQKRNPVAYLAELDKNA